MEMEFNGFIRPGMDIYGEGMDMTGKSSFLSKLGNNLRQAGHTVQERHLIVDPKNNICEPGADHTTSIIRQVLTDHLNLSGYRPRSADIRLLDSMNAIRAYSYIAACPGLPEALICLMQDVVRTIPPEVLRYTVLFKASIEARQSRYTARHEATGFVDLYDAMVLSVPERVNQMGKAMEYALKTIVTPVEVETTDIDQNTAYRTAMTGLAEKKGGCEVKRSNLLDICHWYPEIMKALKDYEGYVKKKQDNCQ